MTRIAAARCGLTGSMVDCGLESSRCQSEWDQCLVEHFGTVLASP